MKNFKWPVAVLVFLLTTAVFAGVVVLRQRQLVNEPLIRRLNDLAGVESVQLRRQDGVQVISVRLAYVPDLATTYRELDRETSSLLGRKSYRLELQDARDETLSAAFSEVHLALYEGERRGNFTAMAGLVSATMAEFSLREYRLTVDRERIYFQARNGAYRLYAVIERRSNSEAGEQT
ncbi:MAG: hypothetical protein M1571_10845 [Firmicutes bacterium]|nr:hypothetical protein [Bacillota bacterium]